MRMAVTTAATKTRMSTVLAALPGVPGDGLVGLTERRSWAHAPAADPVRNATLTARREAIRSKRFAPSMEVLLSIPFDACYHASTRRTHSWRWGWLHGLAASLLDADVLRRRRRRH